MFLRPTPLRCISFQRRLVRVFLSDKLSNLVASNQSLLASKAETETLKKGLHATKEAVEEAKKQAEAAQRGNEQLLQKMRENEERAQRAQQAQMDREARSQLMQVRELFFDLVCGRFGRWAEGGGFSASPPDTVALYSVGGG